MDAATYRMLVILLTGSLVAAACGLYDWEELLAAYKAARQSIHSLWRNVAESG